MTDSSSDDNDAYTRLAGLIDEQYKLSRDLYALTETQLRLVQDMASRPHSIERVLAITEGRIRQKIDRLCELRGEIKAQHSSGQPN